MILSKIWGDLEHLDSADEPLDADIYDGGDREEAAAFIAETSGELSKIAQRHGLGMLKYLLDMTQLEASDMIRNKRRLS